MINVCSRVTRRLGLSSTNTDSEAAGSLRKSIFKYEVCCQSKHNSLACIDCYTRMQSAGGFRLNAQSLRRPSAWTQGPITRSSFRGNLQVTCSRAENRGNLRLYIDSASVYQWEKFAQREVFFGKLPSKTGLYAPCFESLCTSGLRSPAQRRAWLT